MEGKTTVYMLWFDQSVKKSFREKLSDAAAHYRKKYGLLVALCLINELAFSLLVQEEGLPPETNQVIVDGIIVEGRRDVLAYNFLITANGGGK